MLPALFKVTVVRVLLKVEASVIAFWNAVPVPTCVVAVP